MSAESEAPPQPVRNPRRGHVGLYNWHLKKKVDDTAKRWAAVGVTRDPGEGGLTDTLNHLLRLGLAVVAAYGGPEAGLPLAPGVENLLRGIWSGQSKGEK